MKNPLKLLRFRIVFRKISASARKKLAERVRIGHRKARHPSAAMQIRRRDCPSDRGLCLLGLNSYRLTPEIPIDQVAFPLSGDGRVMNFITISRSTHTPETKEPEVSELDTEKPATHPLQCR